MTGWSGQSQSVLGGHGVRCRVYEGSEFVSYDRALTLLEESPEFREFLNSCIVQPEYKALRWETPPVSRGTIDRPFEFVLVNDPYLEMEPEPRVFGPYFRSDPPKVLAKAVPNLGRTAMLVVPRGVASPETYVHLKVFLKDAPRPQIHELWRLVATTVRARLTERRLWVSTAGGGVSWLHVRLDAQPKYYSYRPYANAA